MVMGVAAAQEAPPEPGVTILVQWTGDVAPLAPGVAPVALSTELAGLPGLAADRGQLVGPVVDQGRAVAVVAATDTRGTFSQS